jgi:hypothetical protein
MFGFDRDGDIWRLAAVLGKGNFERIVNYIDRELEGWMNRKENDEMAVMTDSSWK